MFNVPRCSFAANFVVITATCSLMNLRMTTLQTGLSMPAGECDGKCTMPIVQKSTWAAVPSPGMHHHAFCAPMAAHRRSNNKLGLNLAQWTTYTNLTPPHPGRMCSKDLGLSSSWLVEEQF